MSPVNPEAIQWVALGENLQEVSGNHVSYKRIRKFPIYLLLGRIYFVYLKKTFSSSDPHQLNLTHILTLYLAYTVILSGILSGKYNHIKYIYIYSDIPSGILFGILSVFI